MYRCFPFRANYIRFSVSPWCTSHATDTSAMSARNPVIKVKRMRGATSRTGYRKLSEANGRRSSGRPEARRDSTLLLSLSLSPSNHPRPIFGPMWRLPRLLASIWTPCRSGGWLRARWVAMTTTIAPPPAGVLNRALSATRPHMFPTPRNSPFRAPLWRITSAESGRGVSRLWKTHRNSDFFRLSTV